MHVISLERSVDVYAYAYVYLHTLHSHVHTRTVKTLQAHKCIITLPCIYIHFPLQTLSSLYYYYFFSHIYFITLFPDVFIWPPYSFSHFYFVVLFFLFYHLNPHPVGWRCYVYLGGPEAAAAARSLCGGTLCWVKLKMRCP